MPLPVLFIGVGAAVMGLGGVGGAAKGVADGMQARKVNDEAQGRVERAKARLDAARTKDERALEEFGALKVSVLDDTVSDFLETFGKIKNVDFGEVDLSDGIGDAPVDAGSLQELAALGAVAADLAGGGAAGLVGGALAAFGSYGAAQALACASTGTAISALSGAAATNATLAWFGGGALASGGFGMAGGVMVLGGIVAGPALLVMGAVAGMEGAKSLETAWANDAESRAVAATLGVEEAKCVAIRRCIYQLYGLLCSLDTRFRAAVDELEAVVASEGTDYRSYSEGARGVVVRAASLASSVKAVLDVPVLDKDGSLTEESTAIVRR